MTWLRRHGTVLFVIGLLLLLVAGAPPVVRYLMRGYVLRQFENLESRTGQRITYRSLSFPSLSEIRLTGFRMHENGNPNGATLQVDSARMELFVLGFFTGRYLKSIQMDTVSVHLQRNRDSTDNFSAVWHLLRGSSVAAVDGQRENLNDRITGLLDRPLPSVHVNALNLTFNDRLKRRRVVLSHFAIHVHQQRNQDTQFELNGLVDQPSGKGSAVVSGFFGHAEHRLKLNGFFDHDFRVPLLSEWLGLDVSLGNFDLDILNVEAGPGRDHVRADLHVGQLSIASEAISGKRLTGVDFRVGTNAELAGDSLIVHSADFTLGRIEVECSGSIARTLTKPRINFQLKLPMIAVHDFLLSLPNVFVNRIGTARVDGSFEFVCDLIVDWERPDSVLFNPKLTVSPDFRVRSLGDSIRLNLLLDTFTYIGARVEQPDTSFVVGPVNPYFVPYDSIPAVLIQSVILSEDGSFFKNNGFNILQIEKSIAHNIKTGKFARGASTISMQFTKNLFLSREKTLARKFQEVLITWLINHEGLLDARKNKERHKKRLLEIYLNIIEWGPDVYGIGRASEFYFQKKPRELSVSEAVFLATIIPNPRKYDRYFDHGMPKRSHVNYMNLIKKLLYRHDILSRDSFDLASQEPLNILQPASDWIEGYTSYGADVDSSMEYEHSILDPIKP